MHSLGALASKLINLFQRQKVILEKWRTNELIYAKDNTRLWRDNLLRISSQESMRSWPRGAHPHLERQKFKGPKLLPERYFSDDLRSGVIVLLSTSEFPQSEAAGLGQRFLCSLTKVYSIHFVSVCLCRTASEVSH